METNKSGGPPPGREDRMAVKPSGNKLTSLKLLSPHYSPQALEASIGAVNGTNQEAGASKSLERRHYELTKELFALQTLLKTREGLSSGRVGHVRQQAHELEKQIELLEVTMEGTKIQAIAAQRSEPPRSKHFLQAFYCAAKAQLPPELVTRLERAAATKES
jgi:hypothetical protein